MLKIQFPNDNEKLSVYLKNKIPFENITIDLSALEKEALASLKYCNFKNVTFTGNISYEILMVQYLKIVFLRAVNLRMCHL